MSASPRRGCGRTPASSSGSPTPFPGGAAGATVDSRERFYGAVFLGYGLAWIWAARQSPVPSAAVRWLAGIFLLGGFGRLLSMAFHGPPQGFQSVLTVLELALPPVYFWLSAADERAVAARTPQRRTGPAGAGRRDFADTP
ncbi:DUF4345 domain-containing protein [Streptomyces caniferus]|uniref:DUF4345 domain-containing protein n=1 Tax=Streptomyces caniferus TaxID=285557 RepID=UPI0039A0DDE0